MGVDERDGRRRRETTETPELTASEVRELFARALAEFEGTPTPTAERRPTVDRPEATLDAVADMLARAGWTEPVAPPTDAASPSSTSQDGFDATPPRDVQCPSCYGIGTEPCGSCFGLGYHTTEYARTGWDGTVEYVTDQYPCGCSGGAVPCGGCGGRGVVSQ